MTIEELLSQPLQLVPFDKQVWDAKKCAEYLGCSAAHFRNRILAMPTFPAGIPISDGEKPTMRWKAKDVFLWLESRKLVK